MRPIFIGGCVRSGTTMLGSILGASPGCITTPESQFKNYILSKKIFDSSLIKDGFRFSLWRIDLGEKVFNSPREFLENLVSTYNEEHVKKHVEVWIDHTGTNLMHAERLMEVFPEAKFIHIVRDGRAVAASVLDLDWGPTNIIDAANLWVNRLSHGLAIELVLGSERVMRVKFEDIVLNPEVEIKRICEFAQVDFVPENLLGGSFKVPSYTLNQHAKVGQKPDKERVSAWRKKLEKRDIELFEFFTGDLLSFLNYPLEYGKAATSPNLYEKRILRIEGFFKYRVNRFKNYFRKLTSLGRGNRP